MLSDDRLICFGYCMECINFALPTQFYQYLLDIIKRNIRHWSIGMHFPLRSLTYPSIQMHPASPQQSHSSSGTGHFIGNPTSEQESGMHRDSGHSSHLSFDPHRDIPGIKKSLYEL